VQSADAGWYLVPTFGFARFLPSLGQTIWYFSFKTFCIDLHLDLFAPALQLHPPSPPLRASPRDLLFPINWITVYHTSSQCWPSERFLAPSPGRPCAWLPAPPPLGLSLYVPPMRKVRRRLADSSISRTPASTLRPPTASPSMFLPRMPKATTSSASSRVTVLAPRLPSPSRTSLLPPRFVVPTPGSCASTNWLTWL
jgi:hypothetical protein